ncbi:MAG: OmpW family protein [Alphaproteobacteria bacterium]|nr:OmpW family protein [Alphaproteobacteria bacterium]MBV8549542.1 OmpW family protein [Alphaproteobacteria bacterium]
MKFRYAAVCGGVLAVLAAVAPAQADDYKGFQAGDVLLRLRGIAVVPEVSSNNVVPTSIGGHVEASNSMAPEFDASYFFTPNVAVEAIAATARHHVKLEGSSLSNGDLGHLQILPPTVTVQYHFCPTGTINPYVGAGLNYTLFYGVKSGSGGLNVHYDNNFGEALQIGADIHLHGNWFANVDVKQLFLNTTANVSNSTAIADVDLNPTIVGVGIGYKF